MQQDMEEHSSIPAIREGTYADETAAIAREFYEHHNRLAETFGRTRRVDWDDLSATSRCHWLETVKALQEADVIVFGPDHRAVAGALRDVVGKLNDVLAAERLKDAAISKKMS